MFKKCRKIDRPICFAADSSVFSVTNVRVPSAIDSLLIAKEKPVHASDRCVKYQSDVFFLLNQKRLDKMSLQAFSDYLDSMPDSGTDSLSELRSKLSDDQLLHFVKSRYQKRLDKMSLQAFSDYLDSMPDSGTDSLSELRSKLSDDQLLHFVKSRYIQSRSELQAWASYLSSQASQLQGEAKSYVDSLQPASANPEPAPTGE